MDGLVADGCLLAREMLGSKQSPRDASSRLAAGALWYGLFSGYELSRERCNSQPELDFALLRQPIERPLSSKRVRFVVPSFVAQEYAFFNQNQLGCYRVFRSCGSARATQSAPWGAGPVDRPDRNSSQRA